MTIQVLVPSYNCEEWIERCLHSVSIQSYEDYRVLVVDDHSTDGNLECIEQFLQTHGDERWNVMRNDENVKCPANLFYGIGHMEPDFDDVIFLLDGDDFLPHSKVLSRIAEEYEDPDVWLTYGNYQPWPRNTGQTLATAYSADEINRRDFRTQILFNHPITFKYFLWMNLPFSAMMDQNGGWLQVGYDRAIMVPMLEMCSPRFRFINENLYAYNAVNPLSDYNVRVREAQRVHRLLAARPKLEQLTDDQIKEVRLEWSTR